MIDLYNEKKFKSFSKALTVVLRLASKNKETIKSGRADKEYNKLVGTHKAEEEAAKKVEEEKKNVAAMKIQKVFRNTITLTTVKVEKALKDNVLDVTVKPSMIGTMAKLDINRLVIFCISTCLQVTSCEISFYL